MCFLRKRYGKKSSLFKRRLFIFYVCRSATNTSHLRSKYITAQQHHLPKMGKHHCRRHYGADPFGCFCILQYEVVAGLFVFYDAASGEYTSGTKVLRLYEGGLTLENSDIEVRAVKLAREYADFDANTVADSGSGRMHSVLEIIMRGRDFSYSCESLANGVVNFGLKDALEEKRAELSKEDYNAGYSEFESLNFAYGRTFALYSGGMVMPDELKTACSAVSGGGISGASVSAIVIDYDVAEMTLSGVGSKVEANDDAAPVVSPYAAAAAVLPALEKIKQEFSIVGAEYVYAYHGEDTTTLRPTWLFTVECKDGSEQYFAVDAISGVLI